MVYTSLVPYVVFLGDTGTGKSTIVEKLTGEKERSSNDSESFTSSSEAFVAQGGKLIVADTPGSNCRKDKEEQNIWIAGALNFRPVSRILIVSKAQPRIDSVIDNVCKYADNFVELPRDVIGVLVSHMDMVEWSEKDLKSAIDHELGIDAVIFSSLNTTAETLLPKILETCTGQHDLTVNHENFAKLFKIPNNHIKILKFISDEVKKFTLIKEAFDEKRKTFTSLDQIDLAFEFLTYMSDEIADAEKRMTKCNNFTFKGDSAALEAGHVLNMVNQLRTVLFEIRKECFKYQCDHGVSEFRKCPYCGLVWTKNDSCSGSTICGNADPTVSDAGDGKCTVFGTFSFAWKSDKLTIKKKREQDVHIRSPRPMSGCGKTINWKDMATVELSGEFKDTIQLCSSRIKEDPSSESRFGRIIEMTRDYTREISRWLNKPWKTSTTR